MSLSLHLNLGTSKTPNKTIKLYLIYISRGIENQRKGQKAVKKSGRQRRKKTETKRRTLREKERESESEREKTELKT